jgi:hypothetical protein
MKFTIKQAMSIAVSIDADSDLIHSLAVEFGK